METTSTDTGDGSTGGPAERYHLLLELGHGGTAQVFLAVMNGDQGVNKLVVLKFLKASLTDNSDLQQMFLSEARFSAQLNHANIVQTSAIIQERGGPAIVMEYLEGQSVAGILSRTRATIPLAIHLRIIADALRGLHYAHELTDLAGQPLNVVHRDISPQNVFVTYDGQVKIIDFGIAKLNGSGVETETGVIKGKVRYMPPEQIEGRDVDRRADVFAAGVMLWEAAVREKMWKGKSDATILHNVLSGGIPAPRSLRPDVPEELERIILKALAFDRNDRHATAADLEADLEAFLAKGPSVGNRDTSKFLLREFAGVRTETKRIIELHLKRRASMGATGTTTSTSQVAPPALAQSLTRAGFTTNRPDTGATERLDKQGSRRWGVVVTGALAASIALLAWRVTAQLHPPTAPIGAPTPAALPAPPSPTASTEASEVPVADASPPAPSSNASTSAHGVDKAPSTAPRSAPRKAPPSAVKAPVAPAPDRCNPPFFMDGNGIKKPKPECL
jgi:eukaryotic-like serine/threonine-protein kinase